MADGRHFENLKSPYLNEKLSNSGEIWYRTVHLELDDSHVAKYDFF